MYVRNILLLQSFCASQQTPLLFGSVENIIKEGFFERIRTPLTAPLLAAIDFDLMAPLTRSMWVDKAADGHHPGPKSQDRMAAAFCETYRARYGERAADPWRESAAAARASQSGVGS